jgi:hypothetical protein
MVADRRGKVLQVTPGAASGALPRFTFSSSPNCIFPAKRTGNIGKRFCAEEI